MQKGYRWGLGKRRLLKEIRMMTMMMMCYYMQIMSVYIVAETGELRGNTLKIGLEYQTEGERVFVFGGL